MKCLIMTDTHLSGRTPSGYINSHDEVMWTAFDHGLNAFSDFGCDIILHGGDFFDAYNTAPYVVTGVIERFKKHNITKDKLAAAVGNHDTQFATLNKERIDNSGIGILFADMGGRCQNEEIGIIDYMADWRNELPQIALELQEKKIIVMHIPVDIRENKLLNSITTYELRTMFPNALAIVTGDHHKYIQSGNIYNVGNMYRRSIDAKVGKFVILDTDTMEHELIDIPDRDSLFHEVIKGSEVTIENFKNAVSNIANEQVIENLDQFMNRQGVEPDVKEYVKNRVDEHV